MPRDMLAGNRFQNAEDDECLCDICPCELENECEDYQCDCCRECYGGVPETLEVGD